MMTLEQIGRGAQRILMDPAFEAAVEELDEGFVHEWRTAQTPEEREAAYYKQEALSAVQRQLQTLVDRAGLTD